jgi:S1/P1 Nuclease
MQRMPGVALALFVLSVSTCPACAWGLDGHRIVGMIADILLANDQTGAAATQLLGGASLSDAATWADCAKGSCGRALSKDEKAYVKENPQHKTYHYTDVPIWQSRNQLRTAVTRDNDVVQITKQAALKCRPGFCQNLTPILLPTGPLVRFIDATEKKAVFINPDHIRIVKPRSEGGSEIVLDDKILFP